MFNFSEVLAALGPNAAFVIANAARSAGDYLFATLLPERPMPTYDVRSGNMTIRATMAGLVGMDSPFPPTGLAEASTFNEQTAKIANHVQLPEQAIRQLQSLLMAVRAGTGGVNVNMTQEAVNFLNKVVIQPHLDTMEYLRGAALVRGDIDWTFGNVRLQVDYGVPSANKLAKRTGTAAWDSTASKFWDDVRALRRALHGNMQAMIVHVDTLDAILNNDANKLNIVAQDGQRVTVRKYVGTTERPSTDARDTVTLIAYDREGEILDPANPGKTIKLPFMAKKKILAIGAADPSGYRVGQGATDNPTDALAIGYTHLGPTTEGGGAPGRWARLYVPENLPMQLHGQGVTNGLPVIENPSKIAVAESEIDGA